MRIISDFRDYYDGLQAYGTDSSLQYIRMRQEIERRREISQPPEGPWGEQWPTRNGTVYGRSFWLAVAGLIYRGYRLRRNDLEGATEEIAYDFDTLSRCAADFGIRGFNERQHYRLRRRRRAPWEKITREEWLASQGTGEFRDKYADQGIVIIGAWCGNLYRNPQPLILNPCLADFKFGKVMSAPQVFQELEMWIGGVLPRPGAMIASVSDADRYVEHGFDVRTSFRHPVK